MTADRDPELPADLRSLEARLAALSPTIGSLPRDELMYRAGWEACAAAVSSPLPGGKNDRNRAALWLWPLSTAALVLVSAVLSIVLATRGPEVQIVYVEKPAATAGQELKHAKPAAPNPAAPNDNLAAGPTLSPRPPLSRQQIRTGNDYLSLRERVLAFGVDVLPASASAATDSTRPPGDSSYGALLGHLRGS